MAINTLRNSRNTQPIGNLTIWRENATRIPFAYFDPISIFVNTQNNCYEYFFTNAIGSKFSIWISAAGTSHERRSFAIFQKITEMKFLYELGFAFAAETTDEFI